MVHPSHPGLSPWRRRAPIRPQPAPGAPFPVQQRRPRRRGRPWWCGAVLGALGAAAQPRAAASAAGARRHEGSHGGGGGATSRALYKWSMLGKNRKHMGKNDEQL